MRDTALPKLGNTLGTLAPHPVTRRRRALTALLSLVATAALAAGCGTGLAAPAPVPVRIGYFPNITHAPAIAAVANGYFADALGADAQVSASTFRAGPDAVSALFSGAVDFAYIGPNPSINAFQKSGGDAVRVIAGATSGGASLVVRPEVASVADLEAQVLATPQLGNTQDVALRSWLKDHGLETDMQGGGDVSIRPQENAQTLRTFQSGDIAGAWVPEPWATRLVQEGGGKVLVDERSLWPAGRFVTTNLVVRKDFLDAHPDLVQKVLRAHIRAIDHLAADPGAAQRLVDDAIVELTGKGLPDDVVRTAWAKLTFTCDPVATSLHTAAEDAHDVGLLESTDVHGIYDLGPLNTVLESQNRQPVTGG